MKILVTIARILVGGLFIFSGLVKAIDPLGLNYKMQEFFEVWASDGYLPSLMNWFHGHSLMFTIIMITLEVVLGVALLVGWRRKFVLNLLLLLMLFFTFLTSYVLFSGKIRSCGCFGDCIPLTPIQTFTKDIILLLLIIFLIWKQRYIEPLIKGLFPAAITILALAATWYLQVYVMKHLPLVDCLPYKKGNNILELRKMPADAIPDKFEYNFIYEKDNTKKEFAMDKLPDSTWKFVERKQTLIEAGKNNVPAINDFSFTTAAGNDTTEAILSQPGEYYLLFAKEFNKKEDKWYEDFKAFYSNKTPQVYLVTADAKTADEIFNVPGEFKLDIFLSDATAIKTAARVNPTLFLMKGPIIQNKWSWTDAKNLVRQIKDSTIKSL